MSFWKIYLLFYIYIYTNLYIYIVIYLLIYAFINLLIYIFINLIYIDTLINLHLYIHVCCYIVSGAFLIQVRADLRLKIKRTNHEMGRKGSNLPLRPLPRGQGTENNTLLKLGLNAWPIIGFKWYRQATPNN